jgi:hypothetical protein
VLSLRSVGLLVTAVCAACGGDDEDAAGSSGGAGAAGASSGTGTGGASSLPFEWLVYATGTDSRTSTVYGVRFSSGELSTPVALGAPGEAPMGWSGDHELVDASGEAPSNPLSVAQASYFTW